MPKIIVEELEVTEDITLDSLPAGYTSPWEDADCADGVSVCGWLDALDGEG